MKGSITVTPSAPTLAKGAQQQFTAVFSGAGSPMQKFNWSLGGNRDESTNITSEGLLTVGANGNWPPDRQLYSCTGYFYHKNGQCDYFGLISTIAGEGFLPAL